MEHAPQHPHVLTKDDVMRVATDLYGEHSQTASDINVILEEGEQNPKVFAKCIKDARNKILRSMVWGDKKSVLTDQERANYLIRLGYSGDEALEEMNQMDKELGITEGAVDPSKVH